MSKLSRRNFLNIAAAAATSTVSPLGAFFASSARATVPVGPHLRRYSDSEFWFKKLALATIAQNPEVGKTMEAPDGQLTLRLGTSGGFATGYFSTLSFLSSYKATQPDDFRDLLYSIALLPRDDRRQTNALSILDQHRRARLEPSATTGSPILSTAITQPDDGSAQPALKQLVSMPQLFSPLEKLSAEKIKIAAFSAVSAIQKQTFTDPKSINTLSDASKNTVINWESASSLVQSLISTEFHELNEQLENDPEALNTNRLLNYTDGKLKLDWVHWQLLKPAFQDGINDGKLSALGYIALSETAATFKTGDTTDVNKGLAYYDAAATLVDAFQDDLFFQSGTAAGAFKSSIRMKNLSYVRMPSGELRLVTFQTPFLPFEYTRAVTDAEEKNLLAVSQENLTVARQLNTIEGLTQDPKSTVAFAEAAIPACKNVTRDTVRALAAASVEMPELREARLESVVLVPEMTSSWTFTGIGAALCHTHLVYLSGGSLETQEERFKFKRSILASVGRVAKQALPGGDLQVSAFTPVNPALVQYADGYRVANILGDRVSDTAAQSEGAHAVYKSLQTALPEFFKDLPENTFLTADQIADAVGIIATTVHDTIEVLRVQVKNLTAALKDMQDFVASLNALITNLSGDLSSVQNMDALRGFQTNASKLIKDKISGTTDAIKLQTLASLQGLVNTIVTVGVNIENNMQLTAQANAGYCGVGVNK